MSLSLLLLQIWMPENNSARAAVGEEPGFFEELLRNLLALPPQASTVAQEIDHLHYSVILTTMAGALLITIVGLIFLLRYRRTYNGSPALAASPHKRRGKAPPPLWMEILVIVFLLGSFVLWWNIGFWQFVRLRVVPEGALEIYVTAKKWMWSFTYPQGETNGVLYVPVGQPIKLVMTSRDVIHSFFVPEFRVKMDVLPGRYTTTWFEVKHPGSYQVLCTEYCGMGHSTMRAQVVALSQEDYDRWLQGRPTGLGNVAGRLPREPEGWTAGQRYVEPAVVGAYAEEGEEPSLVTLGERAAAEYGCLRCHSVDGSPHIGPTWAGLYGSRVPLEQGGTALVDEAYITRSMMDPLYEIHQGFSPVMPTYQGLIRPGETAAIIEYIKSLRAVSTPPSTEELFDPYREQPTLGEEESPPAILPQQPPPGLQPLAPEKQDASQRRRQQQEEP